MSVASRATAQAGHAALADGRVPDVGRGLREEGSRSRELGTGALQVAVTGERPDPDDVPLDAHLAQLGEPSDVEQAGRLCEPQVHHRHEALAAGEHLEVVIGGREDLQRLLEGLGPDVAEHPVLASSPRVVLPAGPDPSRGVCCGCPASCPSAGRWYAIPHRRNESRHLE
jgi:hypothetical protein